MAEQVDYDRFVGSFLRTFQPLRPRCVLPKCEYWLYECDVSFDDSVASRYGQGVIHTRYRKPIYTLYNTSCDISSYPIRHKNVLPDLRYSVVSATGMENTSVNKR